MEREHGRDTGRALRAHAAALVLAASTAFGCSADSAATVEQRLFARLGRALSA